MKILTKNNPIFAGFTTGWIICTFASDAVYFARDMKQLSRLRKQACRPCEQRYRVYLRKPRSASVAPAPRVVLAMVPDNSTRGSGVNTEHPLFRQSGQPPPLKSIHVLPPGGNGSGGRLLYTAAHHGRSASISVASTQHPHNAIDTKVLFLAF